MNPLLLVFNFAAGFFVCFAIPLLCSSLQGLPFRNPLGPTSPRINFILGFLSILGGGLLLEAARFPFNINISSILFWLAFVLTGLWLSSRHP